MRSLIAGLLVVLIAVSAPTQKSPADDRIDFDTEIIPILTRQGCNAGSCHGAALGRGGFKLSLFGMDAHADHAAIVHQLHGRRVNLHEAERSLLLRKPSERVGHEGGMKLDEESDFYAKMRSWIQQGAKRRQLRNLDRVEIKPQQAVLTKTGQTIDASVIAHFDDGSSIDVTSSTVFAADDPDAVQINHHTGNISVSRGGVHIVIARYLDQVLPIRLTVPLISAPPAAPPKSPPKRENAQERLAFNHIDTLINRQLDQLRLPSSPPVENGQLLRRLTLDLIGRLPSLDEYQRFSRHPNLPATVDQLLDSDQFAQYWALKWANVLQIDSKQLQPEGARAFHHWLKEQIAADAPITSMARAMLTTMGDSYTKGPVNFLRSGNSPGDLAEHVTQVFMGARLRCANCHNHPLDHWTQDDYHGLAAIFAKVKRGRVVSLSDRGSVTHPVTGQPAHPRIPGERFLAVKSDGISEFADWLADTNNPYLARVTANRIWQQLMGRGLVQPSDDLRATNLPTNPALLEWLTQDLANQKFRMKPIIRSICLSAAYQRSSHPVSGNETDTTFFSKALQRPLEAEVFADAISDVTGIPIKYSTVANDDTAFDDTPIATASQNKNHKPIRAVTLTDNRTASEILETLGRCDREQSCTAGGGSHSANPLARALHLINGPLLNLRVSDPNGRLARLLESEPDNAALLNQLYMITLGHRANNLDYWQRRFDESDMQTRLGRKAFFEDVLWSLLSSETFGTNH